MYFNNRAPKDYKDEIKRLNELITKASPELLKSELNLQMTKMRNEYAVSIQKLEESFSERMDEMESSYFKDEADINQQSQIHKNKLKSNHLERIVALKKKSESMLNTLKDDLNYQTQRLNQEK